MDGCTPGALGQVFQGCATTTEVIRRGKLVSQESLMKAGKRKIFRNLLRETVSIARLYS